MTIPRSSVVLDRGHRHRPRPVGLWRPTCGLRRIVLRTDDAGRGAEVAVEATYGCYWAVDALTDAGFDVHLAHPRGIVSMQDRRAKTDGLEATGLADLLRIGRLAQAWIAPPAVRELRELVRYRHKL